jgi:hypothetical protein
MFATGRPQKRLIIKGHQIVGVHIGPKNDVTPFPAVPTIRATSRDKLLPSKTDAPIAAIPGFCMNPDPIDEQG